LAKFNLHISFLFVSLHPINQNKMNTINLNNGFSIFTKDIRIGADTFSNSFSLYKGDLYVAKISRPFSPDEEEKNHIIFDVLGECEQRAFCQPHQVLREADTRAIEAFKEYMELTNRKPINQKDGWCTKTQHWHKYTLIETAEENKFVAEKIW